MTAQIAKLRGIPRVSGLILALVVIIILALLPLFSGAAILGLASKILIFGILAISLDLIVGYAGLWSFCHATFFGAAAYTTAMLMRHLDIYSFWITAPASILMAGLVAALFGVISLKVSGLHFLLVTLALGQAAYLTVVKWSRIFGGTDGIGGIPYPSFANSLSTMFYFVLGISIICFVLIYIISKSPFGYNLQGIRENETRMKCLGYNVWIHKLAVLVIGGLFAGVAGLLYVHYNGLIGPDSISITASGLPWLMVIIGGTGTLWGSLTGSVIILVLQYFVSSAAPLRWPLIIGICYVLAVMFARKGIFTTIQNLTKGRGKIERPKCT